jgi:iron complex outermembrane receptor protein
MASFVRGENRGTGDNLYHIMPLNLKTALSHRLGAWTNTLEAEMVEEKDRISRVRNEVVTPDFTLVNVRSSYEWKHARLDIALENALNKFYLPPLGGAYVGQGNAMSINTIPWGMAVRAGHVRSTSPSL